MLTTTAAEKIYRSDGPVSRIENRVTLGAGARLAWLPQETILFDRARVRRRFEADLAPGAALLAVEIVAFGRAARGERITAGLLADAWRVRRAGRLVYADSFVLEGPISDLLARPAIGGGARACATLLDVSRRRRGAAGRGAHAASQQATATGIEAAASAWNGHLVIRALADGRRTLARARRRASSPAIAACRCPASGRAEREVRIRRAGTVACGRRPLLETRTRG